MSDILLEDGKDGVLIDAALPSSAAQGVIQLEDDAHWPVRLIAGEYFFNGNCTALAEDSKIPLAPLNSYEIDYYYCKSAIVVAVDAADPSPLMGSFTTYAPMMLVLVLGQVCGKIDFSIVAYIDKAEPPQLFACGVTGFPAPGGGLVMLIDTAKVSLPLKVYLTLTSGKFVRSGYILVRADT